MPSICFFKRDEKQSTPTFHSNKVIPVENIVVKNHGSLWFISWKVKHSKGKPGNLNFLLATVLKADEKQRNIRFSSII